MENKKLIKSYTCKIEIVELVSSKTNRPYTTAIAYLPREGKDKDGKAFEPVEQRFFLDEANAVRLGIKD